MRGTVAGEAIVSQASTEEYRSEHARIYGDKPPQRGIWVTRCERCDGVDLPLGSLRLDCRTCGGKDCRGAVDVSAAPPLAAPQAKDAPIMCDRFMEGSFATDGADIGSRRKREEYKHREGVTDASDYGKDYGERVRAQRERAVAEATRRTAAEVANLNPRHVRKYIDERKK